MHTTNLGYSLYWLEGLLNILNKKSQYKLAKLTKNSQNMLSIYAMTKQYLKITLR